MAKQENEQWNKGQRRGENEEWIVAGEGDTNRYFVCYICLSVVLGEQVQGLSSLLA